MHLFPQQTSSTIINVLSTLLSRVWWCMCICMLMSVCTCVCRWGWLHPGWQSRDEWSGKSTFCHIIFKITHPIRSVTCLKPMYPPIAFRTKSKLLNLSYKLRSVPSLPLPPHFPQFLSSFSSTGLTMLSLASGLSHIPRRFSPTFPTPC